MAAARYAQFWRSTTQPSYLQITRFIMRYIKQYIEPLHLLRSLVACVGVCLFLLFNGCQSPQLGAEEPVTISIAGATTMRPVLVDLSTEFSRQYPHVSFSITGGDSAIGEERLRLGQADLAATTLISSTISGEALREDEMTFTRIPIGLDGLVVITHQTVPIENLTLLQLQELFSGRIWNWQELTGLDEPVQLVTREEGSGSHALFDERIMGGNSVALTAVVMPTGDEVVAYVAENRGTIGYVSRAFVIELLDSETGKMTDTNVTATPSNPMLAQIHLVQVEGQLPVAETLQTQSYFLIQPLYLVSNGPPLAMVKRFVDFTLSPAGQAIVRRYHQPIR